MTTSIAVIVPVHNGEAFVSAALASVAAQTRPPDLVAVVDDGSTDGTLDIIGRWSEVLPLRIVVQPENRGLWAARRAGIDAVKTDLLALLDADDVWLPEHLETVLATHARAGGIVSARALRWVPGVGVAAADTEVVRPTPPPDEQPAALVRANWVFIAALFPRDAYEKVGGYRDFRACEDWDLWLRLVRAGARVTTPSPPTVLYRLRVDSLSALDRLLPWEIAVLQAYLEEEPNARLRGLAREEISRRRAKQELLRAFDLGRDGHPVLARISAARGLRGSPSVRAQSLAALVAPVTTGRLRDRRLRDLHWLLER